MLRKSSLIVIFGFSLVLLNGLQANAGQSGQFEPQVRLLANLLNDSINVVNEANDRLVGNVRNLTSNLTEFGLTERLTGRIAQALGTIDYAINSLNVRIDTLPQTAASYIQSLPKDAFENFDLLGSLAKRLAGTVLNSTTGMADELVNLGDALVERSNGSAAGQRLLNRILGIEDKLFNSVGTLADLSLKGVDKMPDVNAPESEPWISALTQLLNPTFQSIGSTIERLRQLSTNSNFTQRLSTTLNDLLDNAQENLVERSLDQVRSLSNRLNSNSTSLRQSLDSLVETLENLDQQLSNRTTNA